MLFQGQVNSAVPSARASGQPNAQQLQLGELAVSEVLPRYAALAWSGQVFYAAHTGAQALSVASGTFTGLLIQNPANSGKNLVILDATIGIAAAAGAVGTPRLGYAAAVASISQGATVSSKGVSVIAGSGSTSVTTVGASATLAAAPTTLRPIMGVQWVTGGTSSANIYTKDEIAGAIIIPPGQILTLDSLVGAATVVAAVTWAELPL